MCGAGGEGAERRGRERTRERANERTSERESRAFLRSSGASWSLPGRPLDEGTERQTDGSRKPRRRRQVTRARRPSRLSLRPELASWRTCVAGATIRVFAGTCVGVHISGCVLNVNARVSVDRCKWHVSASE